jgi:hypothetical protein
LNSSHSALHPRTICSETASKSYKDPVPPFGHPEVAGPHPRGLRINKQPERRLFLSQFDNSAEYAIISKIIMKRLDVGALREK